MKKTYILTLILLSLTLISCGSNKHKKIIEDPITLEVELEQNISSKYPLDILFKLTNLSDKTVYYANIDVPPDDMEDLTLNSFHVNEDSTALTYKGPTVITTGGRFDSLAPGETYATTVALDKIYTVTKGTHHYQISYMDIIVAKTSDGKTEIGGYPEEADRPLKPNELGPKDHTSRRITVKSNTLEFEANIKKIREVNYN